MIEELNLEDRTGCYCEDGCDGRTSTNNPTNTVCPKCGSADISYIKTDKGVKYHCKTCGNTFDS